MDHPGQIKVVRMTEREFCQPLSTKRPGVTQFVKLSNLIHCRYALAVDKLHGITNPWERVCFIPLDYESLYLAGSQQSFGTDFGDNVVGRVSRSIARLQYDMAVPVGEEEDMQDPGYGAELDEELANAQDDAEEEEQDDLGESPSVASEQNKRPRTGPGGTAFLIASFSIWGCLTGLDRGGGIFRSKSK